MKIKFIFSKVVVMAVISALFLNLAYADSPRDGAKDAEHDFNSGTPKLAEYGTEACFPGYGAEASEEIMKLLMKLPRGATFCTCLIDTIFPGYEELDTDEKKSAYVTAYNRRIAELLTKQRADKSRPR